MPKAEAHSVGLLQGGRPRRTVRVRFLATSRDRRGRCRGQATAPDRSPGGRTRTRPTMPCEGGRTESESLDSDLGAAVVVNCTGIPASRVVSELSFLIALTRCACTRQDAARGRCPRGDLRDRRVVGSASPTSWSAGAKAFLKWPPRPDGRGRSRSSRQTASGKRFLRGARRGSGSHGNREVVVNEVWAELAGSSGRLCRTACDETFGMQDIPRGCITAKSDRSDAPASEREHLKPERGSVDTSTANKRSVSLPGSTVAFGFRQPAAEVHPTSSELPTGSRLPAPRTERPALGVLTVLSVG